MMDAKRQKLSILSELDTLPDSETYAEMALSVDFALEEEHQLLLILHAWKSNQLGLVRFQFDSKKTILNPLALKFLEAHELRQKGKKVQSIEAIEKLANDSKSLTILYRKISDSIEANTLPQATQEIVQALSAYSGWRQAVLTFNLGVGVLNRSQFEAAKELAEKLKNGETPTHIYFGNWLNGQIESHQGNADKALWYFKRALEESKTIPSRKTDRVIVLANAIEECLFLGSQFEAQDFLNELLGLNRMGVGTLSEFRIAAAQAQIYALQGSLDKSYKQLQDYFQSPIYDRDHLRVGFFYLWILIFKNKSAEIDATIDKLVQVRNALQQSNEIYDYSVFKIYSQFSTDKDHHRAETEVLNFLSTSSLRPERNHSHWAKIIHSLVVEDNAEIIEGLKENGQCPWLTRCLVVHHSGNLNLSTTFWRILSSVLKDDVSQLLCTFKITQTYNDIEFVYPSLKGIALKNAWGWLKLFDQGQSTSLYEQWQSILRSDLCFDHNSNKILNPNTGEILNNKTQTAVLFLLSTKSKNISKEDMSRVLGNLNYDPLVHDSQIYALVSRVRLWLSKQNIDLDLTSNGGSWSLTGSANLVNIEIKKNSIAPLPISTPYEPLNSRRQWIHNWLKANGLITRADLLRQFSIKKSTAVNDFNYLIKDNVIERMGHGRAVFYKLKRISQ